VIRRIRRTYSWVPLALCLWAAAVVLCPSAARAQVNTEPLRKRIKLTGYSFILEGTLTGDVGNTEGLTTGGGVGGGFARHPHLVFAYARGDYSRYAHVTSVSKTFAHLRYNYEFADWIWGEAFAQAQSDQFQRLKLRNLVGVGPRVRALHADTFDVFVGTAYMLERDVIAVAPGATDAHDFVIARWSNYVTAHWDVDPRVTLATTMYVQPQFTDFSNARVLSETLFVFKVTPILNASVSGTVRYDSAPPSQVKDTDAEIKNTLSLVF